jgi:7-carboxy-7-deazaguanine synthase
MSYKINNIFYSIQSEGARAGSANIFIRFSGCNLRCSLETHQFDCDTEFYSGRQLSVDQILEEIRQYPRMSIILTGGEPALQIDDELLEKLKNHGYYLAIETNGTIKINPLIDWITVSPKVAEHSIRQNFANEVKYIRSYGQELPETRVCADHYFISPAFVGDYLPPKNIQWCIDLVKNNPVWKLSVQYHKFLNLE